MKILVTGGGGFVGSRVVPSLLEAGHKVNLLVRNPGSPGASEWVRKGSVQLVRGDIHDPATFPPAMFEVDAVVHLVGIISECGRNTFEAVHAEGTRRLLEAARQRGVRRWIQMSALGTRPNAVSRYHRTKWAAEEAVRDSGLDWTIFRPSLIYGAGGGFTELFGRIARFSPVMPVMGDGRALLQPVAVEAVARAFARAVTQRPAVGKVYDLCGGERLSFNEVARAVSEAAVGRARPLMHVPMGVARSQAAILEWIWPLLLRRPPPLNRDQLIMLGEDNVGEGAEADAEFGLSHEPFARGLKAVFGRA